MQCEICGSSLTGRIFTTQIEGAKFRVCSSCVKLGSPVRNKKAVKTVVKKSSSYLEEPLLELRKDYNKVMRQQREKLGLSQEQFGRKINEKPSVIKLLESGKLKPNDLLAKKVEHALKIKLLVSPESELSI
ncbi:MAG: multiprotein-bridging factor 1 family protein [Candidatus Methylarchaceae archaeon HK02M1]|nr:multiprotein-bridging factor 1 family protein [Candidatus Methylarchaceae archaeon HK02M1]